MKKILSILILLAAFLSFGFIKVKATGTVSITQVYARNVAPSGLMFEATTSVEATTQECHFVLAKGRHSADYMKNTSGTHGAYLLDNDCGEPNGENKFRATIINYDKDNLGEEVTDEDELIRRYGQIVTAIAYVIPDGEGENKVWSDPVVINIADIARKNYNETDTPNEFITDIAELTRIKVTNGTSVNYYKDFSDITLAENDTLEFVKGTYSDEIVINQNGVTVKGNNFGINGHASRTRETEFTNGVTISANNVTIDGIKNSGSTKMIKWTTTISNLTLNNIYSTATGETLNGGRTTIIGSGNDIGVTGLSLDGVYISCTGTAGRSGLVVYGTVSGLSVENCYFDNGAASYTNSEAIRINKISGAVDIHDNTFIWSTSNFSVFLGNTSNATTGISYKNNTLRGSASGNTAALALYRNPAGIDVEIVNNTFDYMDASASYQAIALANSNAADVFIGYNSFGSHVAYNCSNNGSANVTHWQNYYAAAQAVATSDVGLIADEADLAEKYSKSTYGTPTLGGAIGYELDGGTNPVGYPTSYNLYTQITLPVPTKDDHSFLGWTLVEASDDYITALDINQTGNITLYAHWLELPPQEFAVADYDKDVLNDVVPDIIVNASFTNKKYTLTNAGLDSGYAARYYRFGQNAFTTIADAIAAASAGDVIYVFAGTYSDSFTVNKANVKLIGPNYQVLGKAVRNTPATISGILTIGASGVEVNGLEFTRNVIVSASNATIDYCHISCTPESFGDSGVNGHNRKACIINGVKSLSNLTVSHSYIMASGTNTHQTDYIALYSIETLNIRNNYITNDCVTLPTNDLTNDGMMTYTVTGTVNIYDNEFYYATNNYLMRVGNTSTNATINIYNNIFSGRDGLVTCTIGLLNMSSTSVATVMNNQFINCEPSTITTGSATNTSATLVFRFNYIDSQQKAKIYSKAVTTTNNNCYAGGTVSSGTNIINIAGDAVKYSTLKEVQDAYAEYAG